MEEEETPRRPTQKWIKLNVGGRRFVCSQTTITKDTSSALAKMFSWDEVMEPSCVDEKGYYLLDRDPKVSVTLYLRFNFLLIKYFGLYSISA